MKCTNCDYNNPSNLETMIIEGKKYYLCNRCDDYFIPTTKQTKKNVSSKKNIFKFILTILSYILQALAIILIRPLAKIFGDIIKVFF